MFTFNHIDKEHEHDQKDLYDVHQQLHMRSVDHHMPSNTPASRLLSMHSAQSHPLQSSPPMHQSQKTHQLQQMNLVSVLKCLTEWEFCSPLYSILNFAICFFWFFFYWWFVNVQHQTQQQSQGPPQQQQMVQSNGHYVHHAHQQSNSETRPSVIESSNQALIIECT